MDERALGCREPPGREHRAGGTPFHGLCCSSEQKQSVCPPPLRAHLAERRQGGRLSPGQLLRPRAAAARCALSTAPSSPQRGGKAQRPRSDASSSKRVAFNK